MAGQGSARLVTGSTLEDATALEQNAQSNRQHKPGDREPSKRRVRHPIWLNLEVSDELRPKAALYARLGLILEQVAATRRTVDSEALRDSAPGRSLGAPAGACIVRAVREQGDNRKRDDGQGIGAMRSDEYLTLETAAELAEDIARRPWEREQTATGTAGS